MTGAGTATALAWSGRARAKCASLQLPLPVPHLTRYLENISLRSTRRLIEANRVIDTVDDINPALP